MYRPGGVIALTDRSSVAQVAQAITKNLRKRTVLGPRSVSFPKFSVPGSRQYSAAMYDLRINGGTIVDGTGRPRYVGDVAISGGVIAAIGPALDGEAAEVIDATGMIVAPGFVDIHTHYDGQATWDPVLEPSASHGVTTVVAGNCGVGFAPVRPGQESWLVELMEGVEDIPGTALHEGIQWEWETFPEYLDALEPPRVRDGHRRIPAACPAARLRHGPARRRQPERHAGGHRRDGPPRPGGDCGWSCWAFRPRAR